MSGTSYRGVSAAQDGRYRNKEQTLLKKLKDQGQFPAHFDQKVDMAKVKLEVMRVSAGATAVLCFWKRRLRRGRNSHSPGSQRRSASCSDSRTMSSSNTSMACSRTRTTGCVAPSFSSHVILKC